MCQRQFRSRSAFYQHGKRLSHLKRAMKMCSSRCTTITNGKITSSIHRSGTLHVVHHPSPLPDLQVEQDQISSDKDRIVIHKKRQENDQTTR